jgi:hypothetical protein
VDLGRGAVEEMERGEGASSPRRAAGEVRGGQRAASTQLLARVRVPRRLRATVRTRRDGLCSLVDRSHLVGLGWAFTKWRWDVYSVSFGKNCSFSVINRNN